MSVEKDSYKFTLRFKAVPSDMVSMDREFTKLAMKLGLELTSTDLVLIQDESKSRTAKSFAAVWGYVEQWPDHRKAINLRVMADELGMAQITASNALKKLVGIDYRVTKSLFTSKQGAYGKSAYQYYKNSSPKTRLTDYLVLHPLDESGDWEPLVRTWEKESPELRKNGRYSF